MLDREYATPMTFLHYSNSFLIKAYGEKLMIVIPKTHYKEESGGLSRLLMSLKTIQWLSNDSDLSEYHFDRMTTSQTAIGFVLDLPVRRVSSI